MFTNYREIVGKDKDGEELIEVHPAITLKIDSTSIIIPIKDLEGFGIDAEEVAEAEFFYAVFRGEEYEIPLKGLSEDDRDKLAEIIFPE